MFRWHEAEDRIDSGGAVSDLDTVALAEDAFTSDLHGSAEYRMNLARVITAQAMAETDV